MHCAMRYKLLQCSGVEPSSVPTAWQCKLRWDARSACLAYALRALRCMQASQCIVTHHGSIRDVLHAWGRCTHKRACMLRIPEHTYAHVCKCTPKSSGTSWIFHCLVEIPYPQPNIEIRKPSIELKFTLISVTICSLIFFICKVEEALFRP